MLRDPSAKGILTGGVRMCVMADYLSRWLTIWSAGRKIGQYKARFLLISHTPQKCPKMHVLAAHLR